MAHAFRLRRAFVLAALAAAGACSLFVDTGGLDTATGSDATPDAADGSNDVFVDAADAAGDAAVVDATPPDAGTDASACPSGAGPKMIEIPDAGYCIDSTSVTRADYAAFLASTPSLAGQPSECAWNTTFTPTTWDPSQGTLPVVYVDWCDAYAFCKWSGKRMCGAVGAGALAYTNTDATDPAKSQWYRACSANGALAYPYGASYVAGACNAPTGDAGLAPVASFSQCVGGYAGLFDMVGNIEEWQDSCSGTAGASDSCREQGGTYGYVNGDPVGSTRCDFLDSDQRAAQLPDVGIRCCAP